jgi:propionate CoA-transferase
LDGVTQIDFIGGGNCQFAALAFAQFDAGGNVNVSWFGSSNPGAGGFIDIAHNAKELLFTGSFTTSGLKAEIGNGGMRITTEGKVRKLVKAVEQITYSVGEGVAERGQKSTLITERAVFAIERDGLVLTEVAKGIDIRRDILEQMEFAPRRISEPLQHMDANLFK